MIKLIAVLTSLLAASASAQTLTVYNGTVTAVQAYETQGDSLTVWLHVNGGSRIGPNPANTSNTCELWTHDKTVYSTALAALMSGKTVTVRYKDRGEGTYWCDTVDLTIHSN